MKFFILILILIVAVVAGALWLRTARHSRATTHHPHRLEDSVRPVPASELRPGEPTTATGPSVGGESREAVADLGSDFAWEPEVNDTDGDAPDHDPQRPGSSPQA
ncbi:hypothetical protein [Aeromicrobium sp.]|uniref:hypothetical protein n=1 Tax=Aeromicrobium sp. TaxID=1871063 RepID=UPI003C43DF5B